MKWFKIKILSKIKDDFKNIIILIQMYQIKNQTKKLYKHHKQYFKSSIIKIIND